MDTGIYYKLLSILPSIGYNARVLSVDIKTRQATLEDTVMVIPHQNIDGAFLKKLNNINQQEVYKMDPGKYDLIIKSIIKTLDPDSSNEIKVTFLQWALARDKVLKVFKKNQIPKIKNPETQNIEYYGNYVAQKDINGILGSKYLWDRLNYFKKAKHDRVVELHHIMKILKYVSGTSDIYTRMDYISEMGFNYIFNHGLTLDDDSISVMRPLPEINIDYAKKKIHILEIELAYINRNIKSLKKGLRSKYKKEKGSK